MVLECLDWAEVIERYDSPASLFYLDPPYFGGESDYGKDMFSREQFERMAQVLGRIKGAFIMSINDAPEIRELFRDFEMEEVRLNYSIASSSSTEARELILSNRSNRSLLL